MCNTDSVDEAKNEDKYKDSCKYAVETAKQFVTLASAGVAFVVGLVMAGANSVDQSYYWAAGLFVTSVVFGIVFIMSVVAHINQLDNYDVYTALLKVLAALQIITFIIATVVVVVVVLNSVGQQPQPTAIPNVSIVAGERKINHRLPEDGSVKITVSGNGDIEVDITPKKIANQGMQPTK